MKVKVLRNARLWNGELFYDSEEVYENDFIYFSLCPLFNNEGVQENKGIIYLGSGILSSKEIIIGLNDTVSIYKE